MQIWATICSHKETTQACTCSKIDQQYFILISKLIKLEVQIERFNLPGGALG